MKAGFLLLVLCSVLAGCAPAAFPPAPVPATPTVALAAAETIPAPATTDAEQIAKVESALVLFEKNGMLNGAVLISRDGRILLNKGFGYADREKQIPNTPSTIYHIGEMSMQMTAAAILLLEQDGKLSVDDPICKYLDNCPDAWQPVTVGNLLSHTSGIPNYANDSTWSKLVRKGTTREELLGMIRDKPLEFTPGSKRTYNNSGFVLAGMIIETVSGQSYGDFVKERIFQPLGMVNSGYGELPEGAALGYQSSYAKSPLKEQVSVLDASGGIYSTAEDLFRWNEGLYGGRLLNETELGKMLTSHAITEAGQESGYGIVMRQLADRRVAGNAGMIGGNTAILTRFLDDRVTLAILWNQNAEALFDISDAIAKRFYNPN